MRIPGIHILQIIFLTGGEKRCVVATVTFTATPGDEPELLPIRPKYSALDDEDH